MPELTTQPNYDEIDITNDYMFTTVMQDKQLCMELLEYLLPDSHITELKYIRFNEDGTEIAPDDTKTYPVGQSDNDLIRRIEQAVKAAKMSPEWRDSYMIYQVKQREAELRGEAKGRAEGEMNKAKETAFNLHDDGMPIEKIARMIKVSASTVQEWLSQPRVTLGK